MTACIIYIVYNSTEDTLSLIAIQSDLDTILNWTRKWQMQLNIVVLRCTRSLSPIILSYTLNDVALKAIGTISFMKACTGHTISKLCVQKQVD